MLRCCSTDDFHPKCLHSSVSWAISYPNSDGDVICVFSPGDVGREAGIKSEVEGWMLLVFTIEEDRFTTVFAIEVEDWMISLFAIEEDGLMLQYLPLK